jgi:hypothetical protein
MNLALTVETGYAKNPAVVKLAHESAMLFKQHLGSWWVYSLVFGLVLVV